jgi:RimJ/RimL family protein N-acetyltransferase
MMLNNYQVIFNTQRLTIRSAEIEDAPLLFRLWTDPRVMANVGFPYGLPVSRQEIEHQIQQQDRSQPFGRYLIVAKRSAEGGIGECKMMLPDKHRISRTDIKLLPEHWGNHYGVEVKQGLVDFLFKHTNCNAVEGTPNVNNIASIKMQEAVGAVRVGEETYHFPAAKAEYTAPVHHYIYYLYRTDWQSRQKS